jgi:hypothetical protein
LPLPRKLKQASGIPSRLKLSSLRLPSQLLVGKSLAEPLRDTEIETSAVSNVLTVVVAEYLFINVAKEMKRTDCNIGSIQATLQEAPEVLHTVCVDVTFAHPVGSPQW